MKLLLYCCKAKPYLKSHSEYEYNEKGAIPKTRKRIFTLCQDKCDYYNGKIVAECDYEVEEIFEDNFEDARDGYVEHFYTLGSYDDFDEGQKALLKESCLQKHELSNYLGFENGYAIHIKNLHIFDEPKKLSECYKKYEGKNYSPTYYMPITKAPQNMMYVYDNGEKKILISIRPEWLCKILNGEKTIEVRKKVLKEMIK